MPKLLAILGIASAFIVLLAKSSKDGPGEDDIDYRDLVQYKLGHALFLMDLMVIYAFSPRPIGFLISTTVFLCLGGYVLGERKLYILVAMGFVATIMRFADYSLAPLLIGFILGPMLEDNFARSMQLYDGIGFILQRPMTMGLLGIAVVLILLPSYRARCATIRASGTADGD